MYMYRNLLLLVTLWFSSESYAQIGLRLHSGNNDFIEWRRLSTEVKNRQNVFANDLGFGIDYHFRMKNKRIEFLPGLSLLRSHTNLNDGITELNFRAVNLFFNTRFYILDLNEDCDCPTFSKQGDFFGKGFFVMFTPVLSLYEVSFQPDPLETASASGVAYGFAGGMGLDIGISTAITLTPFVNYYYMFNYDWPELQQYFPQAELQTETRNQRLELGVRVGYRFDSSSNRRFR
jgi:hypothetical protein